MTYPEEDIKFIDDVIGEAKKFIVVTLLTCLKFYEPCFEIQSKVELEWNYF